MSLLLAVLYLLVAYLALYLAVACADDDLD
jgi:hypothetical protein